MRCLWLTRIAPRPADTGEFIYSDRMIGAFAAAGAEITVFCLARAGSTIRDGASEAGVRWSVLDQTPYPPWRSVLSPLPNIAARCALPEMRRRLADTVSNGDWDVVVFDSLSVGWMLPAVLANARRGARRPRLVYLSHNHEETTRARVAMSYRGNVLKRLAMMADTRKVAALERRLVEAVDLVAAISPADAALYAGQHRGRRVIELPPGYDGRRIAQRKITADMPRQVVMVGSFEWVAKQMNLREFAGAASGVFERAGAELIVVGNGGSFLDDLRREFPTIRFTGRVDSIYPYLDQARMAVVPERLGGGFKLKALDYVFNRLPIAALDHAYDGVPLSKNDSVLSYPDFGALAKGIVTAIDDVALLNRLQERAFDACRERFYWPARGVALKEALGFA